MALAAPTPPSSPPPPEAPVSRCVPRIYHVPIIGMILMAALANATYFSFMENARYVAYFLPPALILLWLFHPKCRDRERYPYRKYSWLMLLSLLIPALLSREDGYRYLVFIWWGFAPFAFPVRFRPSFLPELFLVLLASQIALLLQAGSAIKIFNLESLSSGSAAVTNTLPGMLGMLTGALFKKRNDKWGVLGLLSIPLAGKRSVLLAASGAFGLMKFSDYFFPSSAVEKKERVRYVLIVTLLVPAFLIAVNLPWIYDQIAAYFQLDVNIMTSGRYEGQKLAYRDLADSDFWTLLFGRGLGQADLYARVGFQGGATLIHNDYLRLLIDFGIFPALFYLAAFVNLCGRGSLGVYMVALSASMWLTENNMIIILLHILMYLCFATQTAPARKTRKIRPAD